MSKFHVNPETGNPGKCTAASGNCPFGSDAPHFSSKEDAQAAYELVQGNSFGIKAPLVSANKTTINNLLENMTPSTWGAQRYPDGESVHANARRELRNIREVGFASKTAREESSKRLHALTTDLLSKRNDPNFEVAFAARQAYDEILHTMKEYNLPDERTEAQKHEDHMIHRYDLQPNHENYDQYSEAELNEIERVSSLDLAELTPEETDLASRASYKNRGSFGPWAFSPSDVERAKKIKLVRKAADDFDSLPEHVQAALGSKSDLEKRIEEMEKSVKDSRGRLSQMGSFAESERDRRETNASIRAIVEGSSRA